MLNIAYNAMCGGTSLDDIELHRNDEGFLDTLGAERFPHPTTAGDLCRRFEKEDVIELQNIWLFRNWSGWFWADLVDRSFAGQHCTNRLLLCGKCEMETGPIG